MFLCYLHGRRLCTYRESMSCLVITKRSRFLTKPKVARRFACFRGCFYYYYVFIGAPPPFTCESQRGTSCRARLRAPRTRMCARCNGARLLVRPSAALTTTPLLTALRAPARPPCQHPPAPVGSSFYLLNTARAPLLAAARPSVCLCLRIAFGATSR